MTMTTKEQIALLRKFIAEGEDDELSKVNFLRTVADRILDDITLLPHKCVGSECSECQDWNKVYG